MMSVDFERLAELAWNQLWQVTLVALFVMNLLSARRETVCPDHLIENFEANLDQKNYQEA